ncbi:LOW QUALITY PROTEIN: uncharacterized protein ACR2FA_002708 [Aphomia sociella]
MRLNAIFHFGSEKLNEMALLVILMMVASVNSASTPVGEMALANVTRFASGDLFSLVGTDCGPTRCMEVSHGTALAALSEGDGCVCQCRRDMPAFREDQRLCTDQIDECVMASFGRGTTKPQIPFVFLPMKGQIVYPAKEIIFTNVEDAICAVTSAQYLSPSGWVTLRDLLDNDVPFSLYRDEGSTFLQWRGSAALHTRLEGKLVAAHVLCSAHEQSRLAASCAAFRIAGASHNSLLDVRSIPFHAGETVTTEPSSQSQGLSVLESLAICVCVLMLIFIYAAGIIFYVHYKQRQKRKDKDPEMNHSNTMSTENGSPLDSRMDLDNVQLKTNPLLNMGSMNSNFLHDSGLSDVSEHTEDTIDSSPNTNQKFQKTNSNVISAMVHTRRKKPTRPSLRASSTPERLNERLQRRSVSPDTFERAPHSDLSIIDCSLENNSVARQPFQSSNGEPAQKKLYFNPVFFETDHLKDPPPAAIEFLMKIREIMSIAKDKMTSKRFIPILSDIPEEDLYNTIDLGCDIPCSRRNRRFSIAINLKQENSRRAIHCGGCPGCDSNAKAQKAIALTRSNSCKTCVSEDYKQTIVRRWLDDVPSPSQSVKSVKSVAKVSGTPRANDAKTNSEILLHSAEPLQSEETKGRITPDSKMKQFTDIKTNEQVLKKEVKRDGVLKDIQKENTKPNNIGVKQNNLSNDSNIVVIPTSPVKMQEQKNSPNQISRRIRKKLPPPPPPPVSPPEPPKIDEEEPIPAEVKIKMEAVIRELNKCRRTEPKLIEEIKIESVTPIAPKIIIPVVAADSHYYSDDNTLSSNRKKEICMLQDHCIDMDSLDKSALKRRRFSLACGPELAHKDIFDHYQRPQSAARGRLTSSWLDINKADDDHHHESLSSWRDMKRSVNEYEHKSLIMESQFENRSEIIINSSEPLYDNILNPGPLTIKVSGSPVENRRKVKEEFDPDTLDRKPKRESKRVEKILLKSGGSFKFKVQDDTTDQNNKPNTPPEATFTRKIGSLRQIYEAKTKVQSNEINFYNRRGSLPYLSQDATGFARALKTPDLIRQVDNQKDLKPPVPPKQRRVRDLSPKFSNSIRESPFGDRRRMSEDRDRFPPYSRVDNLNARRSGRRSARTRSRRTDLRKLYRTEDSGYMSTDSNDSKRRAKYLMQLRPKNIPEPISMQVAKSITRTPILLMESDTDDLESICDGRSESGGESVETDSVFFGNFDDSKEMFAELGIGSYDIKRKINQGPEQIDSGFMGETNIILSGDSDSEHRSVISIITGRDGRTSATSIAKLDEPPYIHSVEC